MQTGKKLYRHAFSIHDDAANLDLRLFITRQNGWQADGQMLVPSMRRHQKRMPFLIMQQD
jgi:hypothetical protein